MKKALVLVIVLAAVPLLAGKDYIPDDSERAVLSIAQMRSIGTAIEAYATDYHKYPEAKDLASLVPLIEPRYILHTPVHDGWGDPLHVESTAAGYRIVSSGRDGKFDESSWSVPAKFLDYDADAVIDHGKLIRWWGHK